MLVFAKKLSAGEHILLSSLIFRASLWALGFAFLLPATLASAQNHYYQTKPICNINEQTWNKFNKLMKADKQTIYVLHFRPNACPRCEIVSIQLMQELTAKNCNTKIVIATSSLSFAQQYMALNFPSIKNFTVDSLGITKSIIDQSRFNVLVPYVYKIELGKRTVTNITPLLGVHDIDSLVEKLKKDNVALKCVQTINKKRQKVKPHDSLLPLGTRGLVQGITQVKFFGDTIAIIESATNDLLLFDRQGQLINKFAKNKGELDLFRLQSDSLQFDKLKTIGALRNIYLDIVKNDSSCLTVSASVPIVIRSVDSTTADTTFAYSNVAMLINKNKKQNSFTYEQLGFSDTLNESITDHSVVTYITDSTYVAPIKKGFPAIGFDDNLLNDPKFNCFTKEFYTDAPAFELSSIKGSIGRFGKLAELYINNKLGYYYYNPIFSVSASSLIHIDQFSGQVDVYSVPLLLKPVRSFTLFPDKANLISNLHVDSSLKGLSRIQALEPIITKSYIAAHFRYREEEQFLVVEENSIWLYTTDIFGNIENRQKIAEPKQKIYYVLVNQSVALQPKSIVVILRDDNGKLWLKNLSLKL
jgi:hypothetical protein